MRIRYFCLGFVLPFAGINFKFLYGHNFLVSDLTEVCVASSVHMDKMDEVRVIDTRKICHHYQVQLVLPICIFCTCRCHMCFFFFIWKLFTLELKVLSSSFGLQYGYSPSHFHLRDKQYIFSQYIVLYYLNVYLEIFFILFIYIKYPVITG